VLAPWTGLVASFAGLTLLLGLLVARGLAAYAHRLGPADLVTLARATLVCAVTALVAVPTPDRETATLLVPVTIVALLLDAVDGRVARATGTSSAFGARFDMEVDAFLILVLSVHVAPAYGWWVLAIGAARYAYGAAGRVWPWLLGPLPPRYWRKVVAAVQGIVLTAAAADVLPRPIMYAALVAAAALLAESFGRDVWWTLPRPESRQMGTVVNRRAPATVPPGDDGSDS
jgi:phosphatidylglycerophosphate synthase